MKKAQGQVLVDDPRLFRHTRSPRSGAHGLSLGSGFLSRALVDGRRGSRGTSVSFLASVAASKFASVDGAIVANAIALAPVPTEPDIHLYAPLNAGTERATEDTLRGY